MKKGRLDRDLAGNNFNAFCVIALWVEFLFEDNNVKAASGAFGRTEGKTTWSGREPVTNRAVALAAGGRSFQNDLSELFSRERKRNARQLRGTKQSIQVRIQLIEHTLGQSGRIEDGMAAMDHMIVEWQNHQRRICDNAAEHAGIHGVKVDRFGMDNLTEASEGLIRLESPSFLHARHKAIWEISLRKQQRQVDAFRPFCSPLRQRDGFHCDTGEKQQSAVEFRFWKRDERNAFFR